jgi:hypothetical protein
MAEHSQTDSFEREWLRLERKIRLATGFIFVVYFAANDVAVVALRQRLRLYAATHGVSLREVRAKTASDMVQVSLDGILSASDSALAETSNDVYWLEAQQAPGNVDWESSRAALLSRLNERRGRLESEVKRPLVIVLPTQFQATVASLAPDLWHIRAYSAELTVAPPAAIAVKTVLAPKNLGSVKGTEQRLAEIVQPSNNNTAQKAIAYWAERQNLALKARSLGGRVRALLGIGSKGTQVSIWDAFQAVDAALKLNDIDLARKIAADAHRLASSGDIYEQESHDRVVAFANFKIGLVAFKEEKYEAAHDALQSALVTFRKLAYGKTRSEQNLKDLIQSLSLAGMVAERQDRQLREPFNELMLMQPAEIRSGLEPAEREKSIAVLADALAKEGYLAKAERLYAECVAAGRMIPSTSGRAGASQDLADALHALARVQGISGHLENSVASYRESLAIRRSLSSIGDVKPAVTLALCNELRSLGDVLHRLGRLEEAHQHYLERVHLERYVARWHGSDSAGNQQRLAEALGNLGDVAYDMGDVSGAVSYLEEAMQLWREMMNHDSVATGVALGYVDSIIAVYKALEPNRAKAFLEAELGRARDATKTIAHGSDTHRVWTGAERFLKLVLNNLAVENKPNSK